MTQFDLHLDFETYCDLDLKKVGIRRYVDHPSFKLLCSAWQIDGVLGAVYSLMEKPTDLFAALQRSNIQAHAFNAAFETAVLERLGVVPANPISCTMQRALAYGLPGNLEGAAAALQGTVPGQIRQKDKAGHKLMMKLSKPDKKTGQRPIPTPQEYMALGEYCMRDVEAEADVSAVIPKLSAAEAELSGLDRLMNERGMFVDRRRVGELMQVAKAADQIDATRCAVLTSGAVTSPGSETAKFLAWFNANGLSIPDIARNTIEEALQTVAVAAPVREALEIRLRAAKGSVKKLGRMLDMSDHVGRICGQFQFNGAGRTRRWSGRGIQPQNLPRVPKGFDVSLFNSNARAALGPSLQETAAALDTVAPAPLLDCVSWSLRSCITGPPHTTLWGFDFSQIEARVLAWLAGQKDVLDQFRSGEDIYVWAANRFQSNNRQLGKVLVLALGFGMGAAKLQETAKKQYGLPLTLGEADIFKTAWRSQNKMIVAFWAHMEEAARQAIVARDRVVSVMGSGIVFRCTARTLQMRLPSGGVLYYHKPSIDTSTGELNYWGPGLGNKWEKQKTYGGKLAENATQAVARDVMAEAMLRIWRYASAVPMMTVHDEIVYAVPDGNEAVFDVYKNFALDAPMWAGGLPIAGEAKVMTRYGVLR